MGRVRNENRFLRLELRKMVHELHIARTVAIALEAELKKHDPPAKIAGTNSVADQLSADAAFDPTETLISVNEAKVE